jgi:hypothetical protein
VPLFAADVESVHTSHHAEESASSGRSDQKKCTTVSAERSPALFFLSKAADAKLIDHGRRLSHVCVFCVLLILPLRAWIIYECCGVGLNAAERHKCALNAQLSLALSSRGESYQTDCARREWSLYIIIWVRGLSWDEWNGWISFERQRNKCDCCVYVTMSRAPRPIVRIQLYMYALNGKRVYDAAV